MCGADDDDDDDDDDDLGRGRGCASRLAMGAIDGAMGPCGHPRGIASDGSMGDGFRVARASMETDKFIYFMPCRCITRPSIL
jgi:hypothetical protein